MASQHSKRGFTLIELIIVIVIIGILAAVAVPQFQSVNARAQQAADKATAAAMGAAAASYFASTGNRATCDSATGTGVGVLIAPNITTGIEAGTSPFDCQYRGASNTAYGFTRPGP